MLPLSFQIGPLGRRKSVAVRRRSTWSSSVCFVATFSFTSASTSSIVPNGRPMMSTSGYFGRFRKRPTPREGNAAYLVMPARRARRLTIRSAA